MNISEAKAFERMQSELILLRAQVALLEQTAEVLQERVDALEADPVIIVEPIKKPGRPRKNGH